jgi:hypothetical protein
MSEMYCWRVSAKEDYSGSRLQGESVWWGLGSSRT